MPEAEKLLELVRCKDGHIQRALLNLTVGPCRGLQDQLARCLADAITAKQRIVSRLIHEFGFDPRYFCA